jgi:hypothetical protein
LKVTIRLSTHAANDRRLLERGFGDVLSDLAGLQNKEMISMKFVVWYNLHCYESHSDTPQLSHRIIEAETAEQARDIMCDRRRFSGRVGRRFIGMIHHAELHPAELQE